MTITINAAAQDVAGDAIVQALETTGTIHIYGGTPPANAKAAQANNPLASGTLPAFGDHSGDSGADASATVELTGTAEAGAGTAATHFRITNGGLVVQGTVGASGSGADIELVNVSIAENQPVELTAFNVLMPDGA